MLSKDLSLSKLTIPVWPTRVEPRATEVYKLQLLRILPEVESIVAQDERRSPADVSNVSERDDGGRGKRGEEGAR